MTRYEHLAELPSKTARKGQRFADFDYLQTHVNCQNVTEISRWQFIIITVGNQFTFYYWNQISLFNAHRSWLVQQEKLQVERLRARQGGGGRASIKRSDSILSLRCRQKSTTDCICDQTRRLLNVEFKVC